MTPSRSDLYSFEVYPIPIGHYVDSTRSPAFNADAAADRIVELFVDELGGIERPWAAPTRKRDLAAVETRLQRWATTESGRCSVLVWIGHGTSNESEASLLVGGGDGAIEDARLLPQQLAAHILNERARHGEAPGWTIVVVEACGAGRFIDLVHAELLRARPGVKGILLIGSGESMGWGYASQFRDVLARILSDHRQYSINDTVIRLNDLADRIEYHLREGRVLALGLARVTPIVRPASRIIATVEMYEQLEQALDELGEPERSHFISKGLGADLGEVEWNFVAREAELRYIADWASSDDVEGLLIVSGRAGTGKSAILGNVLLRGQPAVLDALNRAGLLNTIDASPPAVAYPNFDVVLHLAGATIVEVAARLFQACGIDATTGARFAADAITDVVRQIEALGRPVLILADALDEARDPLTVADLLSKLARIPQVRVIVGTRASTFEGPDQPDTEDENLLEALADSAGRVSQLRVRRDPDALELYVRRQLGDLETQHVVDDIANLIAGPNSTTGTGREFLFARLAVHEIRHTPELLEPANVGRLRELLSGDHRSLFATAFERLSSLSRPVGELLRVLAFAYGRGLPRAGRIWPLAAAAIRGIDVTETDVDSALESAAPYIMLDQEHGQSVYRLAHRTFQEHFLTPARGASDDETRAIHAAILQALIEHAVARDGWEYSSPYIRRHIAEHGRDCEQLHILLEDPSFLAHADLPTLRQVLISVPTGDRPVQAAVVMRAGDRADFLSSDARLGLLALTAAHLNLPGIRDQLCGAGSLALVPRWAHGLGPSHQALTGHIGGVDAVALGRLGGEDVIVSGGDDGTLRIWDEHGSMKGVPLTGHVPRHGRGVVAVAVGRVGGRDVIVSSGADGTVRIWDEHGSQVGEPRALQGYWRPIAVGHLGGRDVVAGADEGNVVLWDEHGDIFGVAMPFYGYLRGVEIARFGGRDVIVAISEAVEAYAPPVRVWDAQGNPVLAFQTRHAGAITSFAVGRLGSRDVIVTASVDRTIRVWDEAGEQVGEALKGHLESVNAVAIGEFAGRHLIVSAGNDGKMRTWDENGSLLHAIPAQRINQISIGRLGARDVIVTAGQDGTVRVWDPGSTLGAPPPPSHEGDVTAVAVSRSTGRDTIISAGHDDKVRMWDLEGRSVGQRSAVRWSSSSINPFSSRPEMRALATGRFGGQQVIACVDLSRSLYVWDALMNSARPPALAHATHSVAVGRLGSADVIVANFNGELFVWTRRSRSARRLRGRRLIHRWEGDSIQVVAIGRLGRQDVIVAGGDEGVVRVWDEHGAPVCKPLIGHTKPILALALGRLGRRDVIVAAGKEGVVRVWDEHGAPVCEPLAGHIGPVLAIALGRVADRDVVVSSGEDRTLRLWQEDGSSWGEPVTLLEPARALALAAGGIVVASGSALCLLSVPRKIL